MALRIDANTGPVISALIAAMCRIITAIYAGVVSSRNSKHLTAMQAELDKHKQVTLEYLKTYMTLEIDERNRSLEGFKQIIRSVQLLRDKIRRVVEHPYAYSPEILGKELHEICSSVVEAYASNQLFFSDEADRDLAHSLKNKCLSVADILPEFLRHPDRLITRVEGLQREIAADQQTLRIRARQSAESVMAETRARIGE